MGRREGKGGHAGPLVKWALSLTGVLGNAVGVLAPIGEALDQVAQHGGHFVHGFGVIVEENLPRGVGMARYKHSVT